MVKERYEDSEISLFLKQLARMEKKLKEVSPELYGEFLEYSFKETKEELSYRKEQENLYN